jgi:proline iminopeptidase
MTTSSLEQYGRQVPDLTASGSTIWFSGVRFQAYGAKDSEGDPPMAEAKLAPKMQEWQVEHTNLYLKSGGKEGHVMKRTPPGGYPEMDTYSLLLTTTGRKSGEKYVFPLYYGETGSSYILVASKGGAPDHPGWYKNLVANPEVDVQVGTKKLKAKARTVTGDERAKLWKEALKFWPPYADYEKKTEREIPVVVLDPIA